jgi:hypothetical protein
MHMAKVAALAISNFAISALVTIRLFRQNTLDLRDKNDEYYTDIKHNNYLLFDAYSYTAHYIHKYGTNPDEYVNYSRYSLFPIKIIR